MSTTPHLQRKLGLKEAVALNMIDMVGIGPFITMPLVMSMMHGWVCIAAWVLGALLAVVDGCVWSELGAAMPLAGGSYQFLREEYGREKWGRFFSFMFIWQTMIQAPFVVASGAIGFATYMAYLVKLDPLESKLMSVALIALVVLALYRRIEHIGKLSLALGVCVIGTLLWLILTGAVHFDPKLAFDAAADTLGDGWVFLGVLAVASQKTVYSYLGYYNACHLGAEIQEPKRNIPRSMFISIAAIAVLYLSMQTSVLGVVPWRTVGESTPVVSVFFERIYGPDAVAAKVATVLVLLIAFSSLFAVLLGYSRIPYAAAQDGIFFRVFAKLHPKHQFPHIAMLFVAVVAVLFVFVFSLKDTIRGILAMRILVQFVSQTVGLIVLRRRRGKEWFPFRMPLYPLPVIVSLIVWLALYVATGVGFILMSLGAITAGAIVFFSLAKARKEFPFAGD